MHGFTPCTLSWYGFDCANSSAATSELTGMLSKGSQHSPWWMICPFLLVICHTDLFCNASARSENTYSSQRLVCKLESFAFRIISYIKSLHCVFDRQKSTDDFLIKLNSVAIFFSCLNHCSRCDMKDNEFNMFFLKDIYKKSTHIGQHPTRRTWVTAELFAVWHTIQCKEGVLLFDLYKALLKLLWTCFLDQTVTSL